jgi:hypothetical protein
MYCMSCIVDHSVNVIHCTSHIASHIIGRALYVMHYWSDIVGHALLVMHDRPFIALDAAYTCRSSNDSYALKIILDGRLTVKVKI